MLCVLLRNALSNCKYSFPGRRGRFLALLSHFLFLSDIQVYAYTIPPPYCPTITSWIFMITPYKYGLEKLKAQYKKWDNSEKMSRTRAPAPSPVPVTEAQPSTTPAFSGNTGGHSGWAPPARCCLLLETNLLHWTGCLAFKWVNKYFLCKATKGGNDTCGSNCLSSRTSIRSAGGPLMMCLSLGCSCSLWRTQVSQWHCSSNVLLCFTQKQWEWFVFQLKSE